MNGENTRPRTAALPVIRVTLLAGVVFFGAIATYVAKRNAFDAFEEGVLQAFRVVFLVFLGGVATAMFFFRRKRIALPGGHDPTSLNIVGWALGESVALLGGVLLMLSGEMTYFLVGFVMLLVSFVFFPIPPDR